MLEISGKNMKSVPSRATAHLYTRFHPWNITNILLKKLLLKREIRAVELILI